MSVNILTQNGLQRIHTVRVQKDSKIRESDVNFYDYDGTLVNSYTKTEFLALSTLPPNPSHNGLTAQGWNWSLSDAKSYVNDYGKLNIGQMYITSDGKTRIHIHLEEGRLNPELNLTFVESGSFTVDWGDGTEIDTVSGEAEYYYPIAHTYANSGDYIIAINVISGKLSIEGSNDFSRLLRKPNANDVNEIRIYSSSIRKIEIGSNLISIDDNAFQYCYSLKFITIPNSVTNIKYRSFYYCNSLVSIIIPNSVVQLGIDTFRGCRSLSIISLPDSLTSMGVRTFVFCSSLTSVTIPNKVTNIDLETFDSCCSLTSITIPDNVTTIGNNAFESCYSLTLITIPDGVTSIGQRTFANCYALSSITIPDNVTSIGSYAFSGCDALTSITIPNKVTTISDYTFLGCESLNSVVILSNITAIPAKMFRDCQALISIVIPNSVTSIGEQAFDSCYGLGYIKFQSNTPPTVASNNTFYAVPKDCVIYIPQGSRSAYASARYYPDPNTYLYIEY